MKISFDGQSTVGQKTGIGIYTRSLIDAIRRFAPDNVITEHKREDWKNLNIPLRLTWENIFVPMHVKRARPDVLIVPGFAPAFFKPCKTIAVLHDLIGVLFGQNLGVASRWYWSRWLPICVKRADFIICDSESTRRDCLDIMRVNEEKVKVIYPNVFEGNSCSSSGVSDKDVLAKLSINGRYVLSVSTIEPRKNFPLLIEAWHRVKNMAAEERPLLVIAGKKDWGWSSLQKKIASLGMDKEVIVTGYITDHEKEALYRNCEFFVFPSLYEGFGLPVLEAMRSKKAVIVSRSSSLPEISGDAALYINSHDVDDIVNAVSVLLNNRSFREKLAEKGFRRAGIFSWDKAAKEFLEVIIKVTKNRR